MNPSPHRCHSTDDGGSPYHHRRRISGWDRRDGNRSRSPRPDRRNHGGGRRRSRSRSPRPDRRNHGGDRSRSPSPVRMNRSRSPRTDRRSHLSDRRRSRSPISRDNPFDRPSCSTSAVCRNSPSRSHDVRAQKDTKSVLYWVVASFVGRFEMFHFVTDFMKCARGMGFKICPPVPYMEHIERSTLSPDERVSCMCERIFNECLPDFILCVVDKNSDIHESWGKHPKRGIFSQCISLCDTICNADRQIFLESILRTIHYEEAIKGMPAAGKINVSPLEEKIVEEEPLFFANKLGAKNVFKSLLESASVESDWTWDQAMRVIINDKRYGALKSLREKKQAFNEYLGQRKKREADERRIIQEKAREEFTKMLEECEELASSTRWSKAVTMFKDDARYTAVERPGDRKDLFDAYLGDLHMKERAKAAEEHMRNIAEYRAFLESCDFITVNSRWSKVKVRLEDDERCSRLKKIDRSEIFQEYIIDLEKEEEQQQKRIQKEQLGWAECKNQDAFRKLMEEDVTDGLLTAKTHWHDYCKKVKDSPSYLAVASNTSGSTPIDLFVDVSEELEKQYHDDKAQIKEAMKTKRITLTTTWTYKNFNDTVLGDDNMKGISKINLKLIFNDLMERLREKEAKKRQRFADNFTDLLHSLKEITASSRWDESKVHFEDSQEYKSIGEESFGKQKFEEYVAHLQEQAKEREHKREEEKVKKEREREEKKKRKEKEREREKEKRNEEEKESEREKDKGKEWSKKDESEIENVDVVDSHGNKDRKRKKDKDRKHRKHHLSSVDDGRSEKDEKEEYKNSRGHSRDSKKSRQHGYTMDSESEIWHKRHRKDRDGSRRNAAYAELEDGELGEDGEIR